MVNIEHLELAILGMHPSQYARIDLHGEKMNKWVDCVKAMILSCYSSNINVFNLQVLDKKREKV